MKQLIKKYKKILIRGVLILLITIIGILVFNSPIKYYAIIDGSTKLGFVGEEYFNQRTNDGVKATKLNIRNPYLDDNKILHHLRFIPLENDISSIKFYFPNINDTVDLTYSINHNFNLPLKNDYISITEIGYDFNNIKLKKNDVLDIWIILNYYDINSLNRIIDLDNYFFMINHNVKVNLIKTVNYFEKINSFRYLVINYIIEHPKFQIIIFLLVLYALYIILFKFKVSDIRKIKKNTTSIKKISSIIVIYGSFFITVYQFFVVQEPNEKQLDIYSFPPLFVPSTPIYDMTVKAYGTAYPWNKKTKSPDLKKGFTVPLILRPDTLYLDYSFINSFTLKTISNYRVPNIVILSNNKDNKYFSSFDKGIKQTKKITDTISILKGFSGQSNFSLFSKKPLYENELEFHTQNRVYKTTYRLKSISTFNSVDLFLTRTLIASRWLQLLLMSLAYFGLINITYNCYKKIKTIANIVYK